VKKAFLIFTCLLITIPIYGQDFQKIKEGISKEEIIKEVGKPSRVIKVQKIEGYEYWLWYKKGNTWLLLMENEKSAGEAITLEELLTGLLEMASSLGESFQLEEHGGREVGTNKEKEIPNKSENKVMNKQTASVTENIDISVLDARIIKTILEERKAGFRLKIKNNSNKTIYRMEIVVYFFDKNGKIFYEESRVPVNSESWDSIILKPNYSVIYPEADENVYSTVDKMDIDEWDEGKIKVEIFKIETTPPE